MFNHNKFCKYHHAKIVKKGYWDEPKEFGTVCMLIVTEITKLYDENRLNKSEKLADIALRVYDLCGYYNIDLSILQDVEEVNLYLMLSMITNEVEGKRSGINTNWVYLKRCLSMVWLYAKDNDINLEEELYRKSSMIEYIIRKKF